MAGAKSKSFGGLVFKRPTNILIIESSSKIGNGKKVPYLVASPKIKPNRENRCLKKPCGITASLCFDIPSVIWDGKSDEIKRKVMINDFKDGGLRMLDIESFNKALKCSWIKKYLNDENKGKWKLFLDLGMFLGEDVFYSQPEQK